VVFSKLARWNDPDNGCFAPTPACSSAIGNVFTSVERTLRSRSRRLRQGGLRIFGPMENLLIPSQHRRAGRVIRFSSLCYGWWTMPSSSRVSARKMSNL
jgi:hypothetical protein